MFYAVQCIIMYACLLDFFSLEPLYRLLCILTSLFKAIIANLKLGKSDTNFSSMQGDFFLACVSGHGQPLIVLKQLVKGLDFYFDNNGMIVWWSLT